MAFLVRGAAALAVVAGCYSPDLRNCTVSCESSGDCAGAQVCSSDHFCVAKGVTCTSVLPPSDGAPGDAGPIDDAHVSEPTDGAVPIDARMIDAAPPIDAPPPTVQLHLHVDGHGALVFAAGNCTMDCNYQVLVGVPVTIYAVASANQSLDRWTQGPCNGSHAPSCTVTPTMPLTVAARFHKEDH